MNSQNHDICSLAVDHERQERADSLVNLREVTKRGAKEIALI